MVGLVVRIGEDSEDGSCKDIIVGTFDGSGLGCEYEGSVVGTGDGTIDGDDDGAGDGAGEGEEVGEAVEL